MWTPSSTGFSNPWWFQTFVINFKRHHSSIPLISLHDMNINQNIYIYTMQIPEMEKWAPGTSWIYLTLWCNHVQSVALNLTLFIIKRLVFLFKNDPWVMKWEYGLSIIRADLVATTAIWRKRHWTDKYFPFCSILQVMKKGTMITSQRLCNFNPNST